jgi:hypothetical protein
MRPVVRGNGLFEPGDAQSFIGVGRAGRLLRGVATVGVDEQLGVIADRGPSHSGLLEVPVELTAPGLADLHLHPRYSLAMDPAPELIGKLVVGERGEPAAAVHGDLFVHLTEQLDERQIHEPRLQVPQGDVDRGDGHRGHARAADVADGANHGRPATSYVHGVPTDDGLLQHVFDQAGARAGGVGEAETRLPPGARFCHHHRGGTPGERPVGLRLLGRGGVDTLTSSFSMSGRGISLRLIGASAPQEAVRYQSGGHAFCPAVPPGAPSGLCRGTVTPAGRGCAGQSEQGGDHGVGERGTSPAAAAQRERNHAGGVGGVHLGSELEHCDARLGPRDKGLA